MVEGPWDQGVGGGGGSGKPVIDEVEGLTSSGSSLTPPPAGVGGFSFHSVAARKNPMKRPHCNLEWPGGGLDEVKASFRVPVQLLVSLSLDMEAVLN